ncbi:MAG: hypothetical protein EPO31_09980 [Gammaproteobacteria bacterium]|nr:MAG: hypothetical protein EPO31_09980 [Gammaproteobacteria bacterium]
MSRYKKTCCLTEAQAAYIAGLMDGEGTITLTKRHRNEHRQIVVSISNNEKCLLDYVISVAGIGVISKKSDMRSKNINYSYTVTNRQALELLSQINPYLIGYKKERANYVLKHYLALTPRNGKYSRELLERRTDFIDSFFRIRP